MNDELTPSPASQSDEPDGPTVDKTAPIIPDEIYGFWLTGLDEWASEFPADAGVFFSREAAEQHSPSSTHETVVTIGVSPARLGAAEKERDEARRQLVHANSRAVALALKVKNVRRDAIAYRRLRDWIAFNVQQDTERLAEQAKRSGQQELLAMTAQRNSWHDSFNVLLGKMSVSQACREAAEEQLAEARMRIVEFEAEVARLAAQPASQQETPL